MWFITWLRDRAFFFSWWGSSHSDYLHNFFVTMLIWKLLPIEIFCIGKLILLIILAACKKKVRKELNLIHFLLFFERMRSGIFIIWKSNENLPVSCGDPASAWSRAASCLRTSSSSISLARFASKLKIIYWIYSTFFNYKNLPASACSRWRSSSSAASWRLFISLSSN